MGVIRRHKVGQHHADFLIFESAAENLIDRLHSPFYQLGGRISRHGQLHLHAVMILRFVVEGISADEDGQQRGGGLLQSHLFGGASDESGCGFGDILFVGDDSAEGSGGDDCFFGGRAVFDCDTWYAAEFHDCPHAEDGHILLDPFVVGHCQVVGCLDIIIIEEFSIFPADAPNGGNVGAFQVVVNIGGVHHVKYAVELRSSLCIAVSDFGEGFCVCDADGNGYARPHGDCVAHHLAVFVEAISCEAVQIDERLVDGVYFDIRGELLEGGHNSVGHVAIEGVVRREYFNVIFTDEFLDFEVGREAVEADGFGFIRAGHDDAVVVGEDDYGLADEFGVEHPFARGIEVIAIDYGDG